MIETIDTKITETWGVQWNEMETVRDFLQNFYDANKVEDINIEISDNNANIFGKAFFDYKSLIYLFTNKSYDESKIGQFGEGFKASVLNALRNWGCGVEITVGNKKLKFYFKSEKIDGKDIRVIFCDIDDCELISGSKLTISSCSSKLIEEFKFGLRYFYYKENPLFKIELASKIEIIIYESNEKNGYIFYKKLLRAKIDIPIIVVCNKTFKEIDIRIIHDRDRKAFNKEVQNKLLHLVFKQFYNKELTDIIFLLKEYWAFGHNILSIISNSRNYNDKSKINFPENYYARENTRKKYKSYDYKDVNLLREMDLVEEEFKKNKYNVCPTYMSSFGMKTIASIATEKHIEKQKQFKEMYSRDLDNLETKGINILSEFIKEELSTNLYDTFKNAKYIVGEHDEIIGELKKKRNYNEQHIFLNKVFFSFKFSNALATLLHEWAHIYGYDGSRTFSDALTSFISIIIENHQSILNKIKQYEESWNNVVEEINKNKGLIKIKGVYEIVNELERSKLIEILNEIPAEELFKILKNKLI